MKSAKSDEAVARANSHSEAILKTAVLEHDQTIDSVVVCRLCDQRFVASEFATHRQHCRKNQQIHIKLLKTNSQLKRLFLAMQSQVAGNVI